MNTPSITTRLLPFCFVPFILTVFFLAAIVISYQWRIIDENLDTTGKTLSQQLSLLTAESIAADEMASLQRQTQVLTNLEGSLRSVVFYDQNKIRQFHAGSVSAETSNISDTFALNSTGVTKEEHGKSTRFFYPVTIQNTAGQNVATDSNSEYPSIESPSPTNLLLGWLAVEINHNAYTIQKYEILIIVSVFVIAATLLYFAAMVFLSRKLRHSLVDVGNRIEKIIAGDLESSSASTEYHLLQPLLISLDGLQAALQQQQQENQLHTEQATEDLRETLDTIERQNIELSIARKQAQKANVAKTRFLAGASHEIRTPINSIIGFANLLENTGLNTQQFEYLSTIRNASSSLMIFFNNLIDFAKIELGQLSLDHTPIQLRTIVEESVCSLSTLAVQRPLDLVHIVAPATPLHFEGDAARLKQLICNLLNHFIGAMEKSSLVLRVSGTDQAEKGRIKIRFSVNAARTDKLSELEKQTQDFFAATQSSNKASRKTDLENILGTETASELQLSLALCRCFAVLMDGEMGFQSLDTSLCLWAEVTLKLATTVSDREAVYDLQNTTVAVLDQDPVLREQTETYLHAWNCHGKIIVTQKEFQDILSGKSATETNTIIWPLSHSANLDKWIESAQKVNHKAGIQLVVLINSMESKAAAKIKSLFSSVQFLLKPITHDALYETLLSLSSSENTDPVAGADLTNVGAATNSSPEQPIRILAVDDNPANLQLLSELLKTQGVNVTTASDGSIAINKYQDGEFDLIFMDLHMPVMDGVETTKRIRALAHHRKRIPIIALTAHAMAEKKSELLIAGMDDYLSKPISDDQLLHCLKRWLGFTSSRTTTSRLDGDSKHSRKQRQHQIDDYIDFNRKPDTAPVDIHECLRLSNNRADLACDMLSHLLNSLPGHIERIEDDYKRQDFEALTESVHKLHGGTCYCGVPLLHKTSKKADGLLQQQAFNNVHHPLRELLDAARQLLRWADGHDIPALFGIEQQEEDNSLLINDNQK